MCKCGNAESMHSYGLCPGGGLTIPSGHDWAIVEEYGELVCRAQTGGGLAMAFAQPNYVQEYAAWCRYLRTHNYGVCRVYPRGFANEFDLVVGNVGDTADVGDNARLLTRPYPTDWYGRRRRAGFGAAGGGGVAVGGGVEWDT